MGDAALMGLDITAYSRCRFVAPAVEDDADYDERYERGEVHIYAVGWPDRLDDREPGWYAVDGRWMRFQAGSYSGYNRWREQLSEAALGVLPQVVWKDPDAFAGQPFVELINFADNEGAIGPKTSAKLLADFQRNPDIPSKVHDEPFDWFERKYREWSEAFALAADGGFVRFS